MVKMILCSDLVGNIGKDNDLLFKMKEDMKFFRESTTGSVVVMGYNTWLSLGSKPLPNRVNIVLNDKKVEGIDTFDDIREVIKLYKDKDIYVIGGAFVYNQTLEMGLVDEILITVVPTVVENADTRVNLELTKDFNKRDTIKKFIYNEMEVTIESWKK